MVHHVKTVRANRPIFSRCAHAQRLRHRAVNGAFARGALSLGPLEHQRTGGKRLISLGSGRGTAASQSDPSIDAGVCNGGIVASEPDEVFNPSLVARSRSLLAARRVIGNAGGSAARRLGVAHCRGPGSGEIRPGGRFRIALRDRAAATRCEQCADDDRSLDSAKPPSVHFWYVLSGGWLP